MRHTSRFRALFVLAVATAGVALYACSSKDGETPPADLPETGSPDPTTTTTTPPPPVDSGGGSDAGDPDAAPPKTCTVNPIIDGGAAPRQIARGQFLDGPHWVDAFGGLVFSEFDQARIVRVGPDGGALIQVRPPFGNGQPIGNAATSTLLLTTAVAPPRIVSTPLPDSGVDARAPVIPDGGQAPNDLVVASNGNIYVSDPAYQVGGAIRTSVYRISPTGATSLVQGFVAVGALPLPRPNGIALSPDEKTLYVAITEPKRIIAYPVNADGSTGAGRDLVLAAALTLAPDGLAVDVGGNIYVAEAPGQGAGGNPNRGLIEVFKPDGTKWGEIPIPGQRPTGLAFGANNKTLYVTTERDLEVLDVACEGIR